MDVNLIVFVVMVVDVCVLELVLGILHDGSLLS